MKKIKDLEKIANDLRKEIITMAYYGKNAHISSSLCIVDIITALYWNTMKINPKNPKDKKRDRFVLSKGHAVSALYAALAHKGYFPKKLLKTYGKENSRLSGHPELDSVPGIEVSTGSLGHGLPIAVGMALAGKIDKEKYKVFCLISDAECNEGSVWESFLFAPHHNLNNLIVMVDYNGFQALGKTKDVLNLTSLKEKLDSFGWNTLQIDGNSMKSVVKALENNDKHKPTAIIFNTVAGKGISFIENRLEWHYFNLTEEQYIKGMEELEKK